MNKRGAINPQRMEARDSAVPFDRLVSFLMTLEGVDEKQLLSYLERKRSDSVQIPISVLASRDLSVLEVVVKFFRENLRLGEKDTSILLSRSVKTIETTYRRARKKYSEEFKPEYDDLVVPLEVFAQRHLPPLEALVVYLRSQNYSLKDIADLLERKYQTIWTAYKRAEAKYG